MRWRKANRNRRRKERMARPRRFVFPFHLLEDNPIMQGRDFIRQIIRSIPPAEGQTHWNVSGVGRFDLEGNPLAKS